MQRAMWPKLTSTGAGVDETQSGVESSQRGAKAQPGGG